MRGWRHTTATTNGPSYGLYDTTGGTEDWTFWTAGGLGYTFEIGDVEFHPPFQTGRGGRVPRTGRRRQGAGKGGNREAYYEMLASTASAEDHSRDHRARRRRGGA